MSLVRIPFGPNQIDTSETPTLQITHEKGKYFLHIKMGIKGKPVPDNDTNAQADAAGHRDAVLGSPITFSGNTTLSLSHVTPSDGSTKIHLIMDGGGGGGTKIPGSGMA
jgi:hypothetical protein